MVGKMGSAQISNLSFIHRLCILLSVVIRFMNFGRTTLKACERQASDRQTPSAALNGSSDLK